MKKVYPISKEINQAIIETYEYLQTLPNEKARQKHIKRVEKGLKDQYTARMKKLSFAQGKLLIKLVGRQSNQTSYELVKAFMEKDFEDIKIEKDLAGIERIIYGKKL